MLWGTYQSCTYGHCCNEFTPIYSEVTLGCAHAAKIGSAFDAAACPQHTLKQLDSMTAPQGIDLPSQVNMASQALDVSLIQICTVTDSMP